MYKVLAPLPGYGYIIGDIADVIQPSDLDRFLQEKRIEKVEEQSSKKADKKKSEENNS